MNNISLTIFSILLTSFLFFGCGNGSGTETVTNAEIADASAEYSKEYVVISRELSDPQSINLLTGQGESTTYMSYFVSPSLTGTDFKTLKTVPIIAKSLPTLEEREDGNLLITYEIRPEATWDNGDPIVAKDMEFSLKVLKNPKVDNQRIKPYYEFIEDIIYYDDDPKKFTFVCQEAYMLAEQISGDFNVLPEYVYDPEGIMRKFTLKDLSTRADELASDPDIIRYANLFNGEKFSREIIAGAGAYELDKWDTNQRIVFKRKENWWGNALAGESTWFDNPRPEKIIFETINDDATAITALKAQKVDVMRSIEPKLFVKDFPKSEKIQKYFNLHTPNFMAYEYMGINLKNEKFKGKKTRKALAHMVNVDKIIQTIYYGLGDRTVGNIHPSNDRFYNKDLKPYAFDLDLTKQLLQEDGWSDTNGDGTLDKNINGQQVEFTIEILFNNGNNRRKNICLIFQEEARKIGIQVNVLPLEWSVFLEKTKKHEFEMYIGGWVSSVNESDPKQIWHTDSYNDGSNYVGFGTAETDKLIEDLRMELDVNVRAEYYKEIQEILHEEVPYIFLFITKQRIAIHKRFDNAYGTPQRPGYWRGGFRLAESETL